MATQGHHTTWTHKDIIPHGHTRTSYHMDTQGHHTTWTHKDIIPHGHTRRSCHVDTQGHHTRTQRDIIPLHTNNSVPPGHTRTSSNTDTPSRLQFLIRHKTNRTSGAAGFKCLWWAAHSSSASWSKGETIPSCLYTHKSPPCSLHPSSPSLLLPPRSVPPSEISVPPMVGLNRQKGQLLKNCII